MENVLPRLLSDVREKIVSAEDQLRDEKRKLYKMDEILTEEREKWAKEIKAEQVIIHQNEKELKQKEAELEAMQTEKEENIKKQKEVDEQNEQLKKEIETTRKIQADQTNKYLFEIETLERELDRVKAQQKDVRIADKWAKVFQEKELKAQDADNDNKIKEETRQLTEEFARKVEAYDQNLKEIERASLKPRELKLKEMQESLALIKAECEEMEKKNKALEEEIAIIEAFPSISSSEGVNKSPPKKKS